MRAELLLLATLVVGCGKSGPPAAEPVAVDPHPQPAAVTPAAQDPQAGSGITVQMTAATLADDCGGASPSSPPPKAEKRAEKKAERASKGAPSRPKSDDAGPSKAKRKCEQTSIQLAISAPAGAKAADISVKQVEIFDDAGTSLGMLQASAPRKWSEDGGYVDWDQKIAPGSELSVSYALAEPNWSDVKDRFNKTYVVKAVLSVGGADHAVQTNVEVKATTSPPAMVKT